MQICGFQKTTLLDYPEHLAAIIFLGGCNFRCPYCQNSSLIMDYRNQPVIPEAEVLNYLKKRKNILEGICISGGEPTLSEDLIIFMKKIKELDYKIKLDTNGTNPDFLEQAYSLQILDYVAMDIKSAPENYAQVCGIPSLDLSPIRESITFLKNSRLEYELRTTVIKEYHNEQTFHDIGKWISGDSLYFLQTYRQSSAVKASHLHCYEPQEMQHFQKLLLPYLPHTMLRETEE